MDFGCVGHEHIAKVISGPNALVGANTHDRIESNSPLQIMPQIPKETLTVFVSLSNKHTKDRCWLSKQNLTFQHTTMRELQIKNLNVIANGKNRISGSTLVSSSFFFPKHN